MTESLVHNEFSHGVLADNDTRNIALQAGSVTISRYGIFKIYKFNVLSTSTYQCRILAQSNPEIRLFFVSKGEKVNIKCDDKIKSFSAGESNCSLVKEAINQDITIRGNGICEFLILIMELSDVPSAITNNQPYFGHLLEAGTCTWLLEARHLQLSIDKISILHQIIHKKKPRYLHPIYIRSKLSELLVLFLERLSKFDKKEPRLQLRPEEFERIHKVRNILDDHPAGDYSLIGLAHTVGTNETSLKRNFKSVFGITVFGYLTARRMEYAKQLLATKKLTVAAVANEVGYKYPSHFSMAFRKYFGYLPAQLLRLFITATYTMVY